MAFWNRKKRGSQDSEPADRGVVQKSKKSAKRSPPVALEVKLVAIEALESGLSPKDVSEIVGVADGTLAKWRRQQEEGGLSALCRRSSSIGVRNQVSLLDERILAYRREHPEHGVRRVRRRCGQAGTPTRPVGEDTAVLLLRSSINTHNLLFGL